MTLRDEICSNVFIGPGDNPRMMICRRSVEHVESSQETRRLHYDPDHGGVYWNDKGEVIDEN